MSISLLRDSIALTSNAHSRKMCEAPRMTQNHATQWNSESYKLIVYLVGRLAVSNYCLLRNRNRLARSVVHSYLNRKSTDDKQKRATWELCKKESSSELVFKASNIIFVAAGLGCLFLFTLVIFGPQQNEKEMSPINIFRHVNVRAQQKCAPRPLHERKKNKESTQ